MSCASFGPGKSGQGDPSDRGDRRPRLLEAKALKVHGMV
jgi:hypothetical protein